MKPWNNSFSGMMSIGNEMRRLAAPGLLPNELQGMNMTQMCALQYIAEHEELGVFQKDLEVLLRIRRSSVSSLLNKMEHAGLVARISVPEDARLKRLILAPTGRMLANEIAALHSRVEGYVRSILTAEEATQFNAILEKIASGLEGLTEAALARPPAEPQA